MKLYDYYRSTACYRVRIALNIKNIPYKTIPVHLLGEQGEQHGDAYKDVNSQQLVPTLDINGDYLNQSIAIIEYLEEVKPDPALLPKDFLMRAHIRSLALMIACDIHPLNNLRVLHRLRQQFQATETHINQWYHHWLKLGFDAIESRLKKLPRNNPVCYGESVSLADICLIPQVYNAHRFHFPMDDYPIINAINDYCLTLNPFSEASPTVDMAAQ